MSIHEDSVCKKIQDRAALGLEKYGVTVERTDIDIMGWANHLQEELMDAAIYIERFMSCEQPSALDVIKVVDLMLSKTQTIEFTIDDRDLLLSKLLLLVEQLKPELTAQIDDELINSSDATVL